MQSVKESVSVVLKTGDQVLLVKRKNSLNAFPGYVAFPGGKIEDCDEEARIPGYDHLEARVLSCAFREIEEELALDLSVSSSDIIGIEEIAPFTTPSFNPVRFKNRTLMVELKSPVKVIPNPDELAAAEWKTFKEWKTLDQKGKLLMVPPVRAIIQNDGEPLLIKKAYEELTDLYSRSIFEIEPFKGFLQIPVPSNTIPPAVTTNCFRFNDLVIDPSPKNEIVLNDLIDFLKARGVKRIFITHHHGDHNQYLDLLAKALDAEILMGEFTFNRLSQKFNFNELRPVKIVKSGDVIGSWLGEDLKLLAVPGHDAGQLAVYPDSHQFIIVGDLIQGVGTVVIPTDEGNMKDYFESLETCIHMTPRIIIPSHGIAMGGTHFLEVTLEHRKMREAQVKALMDKGINAEEMVDEIYPDLDQRLKPLALENIKSHLIKLKSN